MVLNFSRDTVAYSLPSGLEAGKIVMSNLGQAEENSKTLTLKGWEARVYKVGK